MRTGSGVSDLLTFLYHVSLPLSLIFQFLSIPFLPKTLRDHVLEIGWVLGILKQLFVH